MQTIQVTEQVYRRFSERAARLHLTPEYLLDLLLGTAFAPEDDDAGAVPAPGSEDDCLLFGRLSRL